MRRVMLIACALYLVISCADDSSSVNADFPDGIITYVYQNKIYAVNAKAGSQPVKLSGFLNDLSPLPSGSIDEWINVSSDGAWFVLSTARFNNADWPALAVVKTDFSEGAAVTDSLGNPMHGAFGTISAGGSLIVCQMPDDSGHYHLYALRKNGSFWRTPVNLTQSSPFNYHGRPYLSSDGTRVVFDAGNDQYAQHGACIASVNTDGSGFQILIRPTDYGDTATHNLRHPAITSTNAILFEADWEGEQLWKLDHGSTTPYKLNDVFHNDNSPCLLADGRIVSLWLNRSGNPQGYHEIKVMSADGSAYEMILTGKDVTDDTIGAGGM